MKDYRDFPVRRRHTPALLVHFHIPGVDALAGQRPVVDILGHAEEQLMAPEKMSRRFLSDQTHGLAE